MSIKSSNYNTAMTANVETANASAEGGVSSLLPLIHHSLGKFESLKNYFVNLWTCVLQCALQWKWTYESSKLWLQYLSKW